MNDEFDRDSARIKKEVSDEWEAMIESDSDRLENMEEIVKDSIDNRQGFGTLSLWLRVKNSFARLADNLTRSQRYAIGTGAVAAVIIGLLLGWFIGPSLNKSKKNTVIFKVSASNAKNVGLAGDFSAYEPLNMKDSDGDGVWTIRLPLEAGKYEYYYLVDGKKISGNYPLADEVVRDWQNRKNGIRFIGKDDKEEEGNKQGKSA